VPHVGENTSVFMGNLARLQCPMRSGSEPTTFNSISLNFQKFRRFSQISDGPTAKRMKIDQYCQRQHCKHVELEQFLECFRVARVCQRQLGFLVDDDTIRYDTIR